MMAAAVQPNRNAERLSIIIATFNAAASLQRCLDSVFKQDLVGCEVLIADGGSIDGTLELIRENEAALAWWCSENDLGIYDAWNKALTHARGEYVCFIGADDVFGDEQALSRLFACIGSKRYDLVTSRGNILNPDSGKVSEFGSEWNYRRVGRRMIVCHPGLLHLRSLFDRFGKFNTQYRIAGDLEFLLRLPSDIRTLHVDSVSVIIETGGVSRTAVMRRLREQREILARCARYGPVRAYLAWLDKLWRLPIARLLDLPH